MKDAAYHAISQMNEQELREANALIVHRLNDLASKKAREFRPGQRVCWVSSQSGMKIFAIVQKANRKTVSVLADSGTLWRVSPQLLSPA
jgi:hypothetical protein